MEKVKTWEDVIDNLYQFTYISKHNKSKTLDRLSSFFHWYYFPKQDFFAPSKFLGYKETDLLKYRGQGSGGETQDALKKFFDKLPKESFEFENLYKKLSKFANSLNKTISKKIINGTGEIYVPKKEFMEKESAFSQDDFDASTNDLIAQMEEEDSDFIEGEKVQRFISIYERKANLRAKAIQIHGLVCEVCGFDFGLTYGEHGKGFIEVHHKKPLSFLVEPSTISPKDDMSVLCANCHRMIHRNSKDVLSIEGLKELMRK